jgi:hypothetical protein
MKRVTGVVLIGALAVACGPRMNRKQVASHTYASTARCSQGPVEAEFTATGAKWGESIEIYACGPRGVRALANVEVDGAWANSGPVGFGDRDNSRCVLRDAEVAATPTTPASGGASSTADSGSTREPVAEAAPPSTVQFREVYGAEEVCKYTMSTVLALDTLEAGATIRVKIWSNEPNDLEGALFQVVHHANKPNVSDEEWAKHVAKQEAKWEKELAEAEAEAEPEPEPDYERMIAEAEVYTGPTTAPPSPRAEAIPPSPSTNAEWVAGYWYWNVEAWMWIDGQWRIPDTDVSGGHLVSAPFAPPAVRAEAETNRPASNAVWATGYWAWDGTAYVWIAGTWRIPPTAGVAWRAHGWRITTSGAIFVPGGWLR